MTTHTVLVEFICKPGMRSSIIQGLADALPETRSFAGAVLIDVYTDADDPDRLVFWEQWESRADQEAYLRWRSESGVLAAFAELLSEPPRFIHLTPAPV